MAATTEALEAASRLNEQLDRKEEVAVQLREECKENIAIPSNTLLLSMFVFLGNIMYSVNASKTEQTLSLNFRDDILFRVVCIVWSLGAS